MKTRQHKLLQHSIILLGTMIEALYWLWSRRWKKTVLADPQKQKEVTKRCVRRCCQTCIWITRYSPFCHGWQGKNYAQRTGIIWVYCWNCDFWSWWRWCKFVRWAWITLVNAQNWKRQEVPWSSCTFSTENRVNSYEKWGIWRQMQCRISCKFSKKDREKEENFIERVWKKF